MFLPTQLTPEAAKRHARLMAEKSERESVSPPSSTDGDEVSEDNTLGSITTALLDVLQTHGSFYRSYLFVLVLIRSLTWPMTSSVSHAIT